MKREANFTLVFRHWLKANPMPSGGFELKQTTTGSLPFSSVEDHQLEALMAVKTGTGVLYKAPDDSRSVKPFDLFYLTRAEAYVVIKYPGEFSMISVEKFVLEGAASKRRSLTKERARVIAYKTVPL